MTRADYYQCLVCGEGEMLCDIAVKTYDDKFQYTCDRCEVKPVDGEGGESCRRFDNDAAKR